MAKKYTSPEPLALGLALRNLAFYRADILFHEVDHSGASYEGRVFLNNLDANEETAPTLENDYAGSFYIFGHGGCFGDAGHCELKTGIRLHDHRPAAATAPTEAAVTITEALKRVVTSTTELSVTVVPVIIETPERCDIENTLKFKSLEIVTYA
jgi:tyrosinase